MSASNIILTLVGGPSVFIDFEGVRLLTDPTFDPPGQYQGPHSAVKHVKTHRSGAFGRTGGHLGRRPANP